jgi:hypothetical protein
MHKLIPVSLFGAVLLLILPLPAVQAQGHSPLEGLQQQIHQLQAQVNALRAQLAAVQSNTVLQLNGRLTLNATDPTRPTALFTGVNVQIVNGTGNTASANGLGNLVIGYDMARNDNTFFCSIGPYADAGSCANAGGTWAPSHKTGSHYLIIGDQNNYSRWGGLVVGYRNTSNAQYASVSGGFQNNASGYGSSVSGGYLNAASGYGSSVSGGRFNAASGVESSVSGGAFNVASGPFSSVSGGGYLSGGFINGNTASGTASSVSGGAGNTASGADSSVSGGLNRSATIEASWAAGTFSSP